jgi:integrase
MARLRLSRLSEKMSLALRAGFFFAAPPLEEHQRILAAEVNPERKMFYQLCWHLGGSQGDIASLKGEDVDWQHGTVSFTRKKTGVPVIVHLGSEALNIFKDLPAEGVLFPYLSRARVSDRATEFKSRCRQLGINGVSLHSYRYAWAQRAKTIGYPERFAQEAFGPQQQGRASRLRQARPDENSFAGRLRATGRKTGRTSGVNAAKIKRTHYEFESDRSIETI